METLDDIQDAVDRYLVTFGSKGVEFANLVASAERIRFFERYRSLIHEKEAMNDDVAADVLGWAYEKLAEY